MHRETLAALLTFGTVACGDPCRDYCETFADKTASCDLGGPSGEAFIDQCAEQVEAQFSSDYCEDAETLLSEVSCPDFRDAVCDVEGAEDVYSCEGV